MAELIGSKTTDTRFSLTPERVDETQRQTYIDNFDSTGFVNSKTAMENVAYSPTVMDEVSASQTAMEAVSASQIAMEAVSASQTAMDEVSASQTAMDEVSASQMALPTALSSPYVVSTFWSKQDASQTIWNEGEFDLSDVPTWISPTIDLSHVSTLKVDTEQMRDYGVAVYIDDEEIFSSSSEHSWTTRSLDVSDYFDESVVKFDWDYPNNPSYKFIDSGFGNGDAIKVYSDGYVDERYGNFRNLRFE